MNPHPTPLIMRASAQQPRSSASLPRVENSGLRCMLARECWPLLVCRQHPEVSAAASEGLLQQSGAPFVADLSALLAPLPFNLSSPGPLHILAAATDPIAPPVFAQSIAAKCDFLITSSSLLPEGLAAIAALLPYGTRLTAGCAAVRALLQLKREARKHASSCVAQIVRI